MFSPATSPSLTKLIPILALANRWSIWSLDIKDAFLQVPQTCTLQDSTRKRKSSSTRNGSQMLASWLVFCGANFVQNFLQQEGYEKSIANPALFHLIKNGKVVSVCIVHVDDLQAAGKVAVVKPVLEALAKKVKLQVEGPFLTEEDYRNGFSKQSVLFSREGTAMKTESCLSALTPSMSPSSLKSYALDREERKLPLQQEMCRTPMTKELDENKKNVYRSCVGILLYFAQDRPDIQYAVRNLQLE